MASSGSRASSPGSQADAAAPTTHRRTPHGLWSSVATREDREVVHALGAERYPIGFGLELDDPQGRQGCPVEAAAGLQSRTSDRTWSTTTCRMVISPSSLPAVTGECRMRPAVSAVGPDPHRYATAKGRKAFAGTAPITRSSGLRTVVVARAACHQRLVDACYPWAFAALTASPGARRCYDAHRTPRCHPSSGAASAREPACWRPARLPGPPGRLPGADCLASRRTRRLTQQRGCRGCNPPAYWPFWLSRGPVGQDVARSRRGAKEVGRLSGCRRRRLKRPTCFGGAA
jgi:hypothetical protein